MRKLLLLCLLLYGFIPSLKSQGPTEIWGVTRYGGKGFGALFKTDRNGQSPYIAHFFGGKFSGKYAYLQFQESLNNKLYGVMGGGIYNDGVIVELDPATGIVLEKSHFNKMIDGDFPRGMTLGPNGKFYGTMMNSPSFDGEYVFEYDVISNTITKKTSLKTIYGKAAISKMILANNGRLYGVTTNGGINDSGLLYEYTISSDSLIKWADFTPSNVGGTPGRDILEYNNKLYGYTQTGGINGGGTIYEYDISTHTLAAKYKFNKMSGSGSLTLGNDGLFYGTTQNGPTNLIPGVFFKFDPVHSIFTIIQNFDHKTTGTNPNGNIEKCKNGLLYGMLAQGGIYGGGSIYEYNPASSKFKIVFNFKDTLSGLYPLSGLKQASNGKLYAATQSGGKYNSGVLFEFDIVHHIYKKLQDLGEGIDGDNPEGTLTLADNGKIYTVTSTGGKFNSGVLVECDPTLQPGIFIKKFDFGPSGINPMFAPVQGPNGKLYGTTTRGGKSKLENGTLYEYDPALHSLVTKIYFSDSTINGHHPGGITLASNNKFYGFYSFFESNNSLYYVLYEFDPVTGMLSKRANLQKFPRGRIDSPLLLAKNGKLYGIFKTNDQGKGILFEYTPGGDTVIVKAELKNIVDNNGFGGNLVETTNGKIIGVTTCVTPEVDYLFEYDYSSHLVKKLFTFNNKANGLFPVSSLLFASNGNVYGMTSKGGSHDMGVLFEYDLLNNMYTKKFDFNGSFGMNPQKNNNLIEVCKSFSYQPVLHSIFACEGTDLSIYSEFNQSDYEFQWYKNNEIIPSAIKKNLLLSSVAEADAGIYSCKVNNGCRNIQTGEKTVKVLSLSDPDCGVGINEQEKVTFEMYPNPATDEFQIRRMKPGTHRITIELVDVLGKSVLQKELILTDEQVSVNIGQLQRGIYFVRMQNTEATIFETQKLIKQ